jgi:hypothetical protein
VCDLFALVVPLGPSLAFAMTTTAGFLALALAFATAVTSLFLLAAAFATTAAATTALFASFFARAWAVALIRWASFQTFLVRDNEHLFAFIGGLLHFQCL